MSLCDKCPDGIRGKCCHFNIELEGYNVILEGQFCKLLDRNTGKCTDYENRHKIPYCMDDSNMFGHGGLPKGCLYLKEHPELEPNPKISIIEIAHKLKPESIMKYNIWNNINNIERFAIIP